jgi:hypothetical protein
LLYPKSLLCDPSRKQQARYDKLLSSNHPNVQIFDELLASARYGLKKIGLRNTMMHCGFKYDEENRDEWITDSASSLIIDLILQATALSTAWEG